MGWANRDVETSGTAGKRKQISGTRAHSHEEKSRKAQSIDRTSSCNSACIDFPALRTKTKAVIPMLLSRRRLLNFSANAMTMPSSIVSMRRFPFSRQSFRRRIPNLLISRWLRIQTVNPREKAALKRCNTGVATANKKFDYFHPYDDEVWVEF